MRPKSWSSGNLEITEKSVDGVTIKLYADRPRSLGEILKNTADAYPDKCAFIYQDQTPTYGEFRQRVDRVSSALRNLSMIQKGDRVALLFTNTIEFCVCYFAVIQIGGICVPLNYRLSSEEFEYQLQDNGSKALILEPAFWERIQPIRNNLNELKDIFVTGGNVFPGTRSYEELEEYQGEPPKIPPIDEEDIGSIMYTSGTTGKPKGAMMCHRNLICNSITAAHLMEVDSDTKQIVLTPLFHASALHSQLITSVLKGGTCLIMKEFKTREALELIDREKVNLIIAVPTMYWFWVNAPEFDSYDMTSVRYTISGAAPAAPELIKQLAVKFPNSKFINAGGLTESTSFSYGLPPKDALKKLGSIGWTAPCVEIKVVDGKGEETPVNESGELWFKGPAICKGYWNNPQGTKNAFTEGWLHTGDVGKVDEDGYLFLQDRIKDMIIRGGENIYCVELENVLYSHPKVLEAAVVGVPDKIFGEQVKAVIVPKPGETATEEEIREYCFTKLADYKVPKIVTFKDALPRNPSGKVLKSLLK